LAPAFADSQTRDLLVTERNEHSSFMVRVAVDQKDRAYEEGEKLTAAVISERAGYLYLIYCNAAGKSYCVFPNKYQMDNRIPKKQPITIPSANSPFEFTVGGPVFGQEVLKAIVTEKPLTGEMSKTKLIAKEITPLETSLVKDLLVTLKRRPQTGWAEHSVEIKTYRRGVQPPPPRTRRVGLFIGISNYKDGKIRDLKVCHKDAELMQQVFKKVGRLDLAILLTEEKATHEGIQKAICQTIKEATQPGDEVFIFWSGHGGRCADDGGEEQDGYDEYLVPHDASLANLEAIRSSMITDDVFGRWLQMLDGRRIAVILDTCFSGGQSANAKSAVVVPAKTLAPFDFFDQEVSRIKDLGQKELTLLASSDADQISFERKEGDYSVMTFILQNTIDRQNSVTIEGTYEVLKVEVPKYINKNFPGFQQTPRLDGKLSPPLKLR
ncbi:MAG: caspase family protein, partial [Planctomycetaceae bacterium]|nr:caspase family protein [Planctomycetaceae bacterium]